MLSNEKVNYTDKEIIEKGSKALIKELGYSGFLRFIRYSEELGKEDYLNLEKEVFKDKSVEEIYESAETYWEDKNS
ncbi:phage host-nuclease inhibitor protein Gam [Gracilibacillus halotolerans]|uniref:Phage host-nuclease inhibitor protein Gam n=1 Tax=Gracilibacillus halotolerans TaxID=74386 RepID=A0A841RRZ4_9BACI|nr:hypothetical protein [Gracilibacillus halotolerans]MBB6514106.1 phage host-nuclease inhibitor protein Gam [Gracilibacillus halotolerans]